MDCAVSTAQSEAALQILMAERRAGLCRGQLGRGRSIHHVRFQTSGSSERHSALGLLHAVAEKPTCLDQFHDLDGGHRHSRVDYRADRRRLDVFAKKEISPGGRADRDSISRTEAVAYDN